IKACGIAGLLVLVSGNASAAGFALIEQSISGMGSAYAIGSAGIDDASTLFFNPAGMSRLPGSMLTGNLQVVNADTKVDAMGYYNPKNAAITGTGIGAPAPVPVIGKTKDDAGLLAAVPSGYISHQYNDRIWMGVGVFAPFGLTTEYDDNWVGRYHAIKSELLTYNLNPSIAFRLNEHASVGFGISAMYADGELTQAADVALGGFLRDQALPVPTGFPPPPTGSGTIDSKAKVTGTDWGFGFNMGVLLEPTDHTRLGLHYRSKIELELDGNSKISGPVFNEKQDAELDVTLPDSLSLSAYHGINPQWAVMADITWTQWSRLNSLVVEFQDGSLSVTPLEWEDSTRYAIGTEYTYNRQWIFRGGVALDNTPVPKEALRTPRVPDNDRTWLTFGATYKFTPEISFDFGYAHLFVDDPKLSGSANANDPTAPFPVGLTGTHALDADYDAAVDIFSVGFNWKFK
ncbi:MAG: outer membrane protein transport protein, partial [Gammaproteobacteria bacterium]